MTLAVHAYNLTADFPRQEAFGLTAQIRRAATSIAANIAEGYGRESTGSYTHFLRVSQGSLKELETLLILSGRVSLSTVTQVTPFSKNVTSSAECCVRLYARFRRGTTRDVPIAYCLLPIAYLPYGRWHQ